MIDIVVPVLGRPANAEKVATSAAAGTEGDYTLTFVCSPGDDAQISAVRATGCDYIIANWDPGPGDGARKWNSGYRNSGAPFVFLAADDLEFERGWDTEALAVAERTHAGVIGTNDAANPMVKRGLHSTHSLVRRSYIDSRGGTFDDGPGIVYHEGYDHQYVDTELVTAARERREWAFARRSVVRHLHPLFTRGTQMDETYRKALARGSEDRRLYEQRLAAFAESLRT